MTDRCTTEQYPNGSWCVTCAVQPFIPHVPAHVDIITVRAWDSGADTVAILEAPNFFQFHVNPGVAGAYVGLFDGSLTRDQTNPMTLRVALYAYTIGSSSFIAAFSGGIRISDPINIDASETFRIERVFDTVIFKINGDEIARTDWPGSLTRGGACLYQSNDEVVNASFGPLTGYEVDVSGYSQMTMSAIGNTFANFGTATLTLSARGEQQGQGIARMVMAAQGNTFADYGIATMTMRATGYSDLDTPLPNFGIATMTMTTAGDLHASPLLEGGFDLFMNAQGNTFANYGISKLTMSAVGSSTPPIITEFIIGLQSAGVTQLTMGYDQYNLHDTLSLHDAIKSSLRILLQDTLKLSSTMGSSAALQFVMTDILGLSDKFSFHFMAVLNDTLQFIDSLPLRMNLAALVDTLVLHDAMPNVLTAYQLIASILVLRDALNEYLILPLEDELLLADALETQWQIYAQMVDQLQLSDDLTGTGNFVAILPDTITLDDDISSVMNAIVTMKDGIKFSCRLFTENGEYIAYAMNTETTGVTKYENYGFNSYAEVNGVLLGFSEHGIFQLGNETDDGTDIDAFMLTGVDNLGNTFFKRMLKGYLGLRTNGDMTVTFITTSPEGIKKAETYLVDRVLADDFRETNVDIGKGLRSVYWAAKIANVKGSDFDLDGLYLIPLICGKRSNG